MKKFTSTQKCSILSGKLRSKRKSQSSSCPLIVVMLTSSLSAISSSSISSNSPISFQTRHWWMPTSSPSSSKAPAHFSTGPSNLKNPISTKQFLMSTCKGCWSMATIWSSSSKDRDREQEKPNPPKPRSWKFWYKLCKKWWCQIFAWFHWLSTMKRYLKATLSPDNCLVRKKLNSLCSEWSKLFHSWRLILGEFTSRFLSPFSWTHTSRQKRWKYRKAKIKFPSPVFLSSLETTSSTGLMRNSW